MLNDLPNQTEPTDPSSPSANSTLAPGLNDYQALKAANVTSQASMAQVQAKAISRLNMLVNGLMEFGVQFPFLQQQIEMLAQIGEDSKQQILINLGPLIDAETAQGSQDMSQTQAVSSVPPQQGGQPSQSLGLSDVPGM